MSENNIYTAGLQNAGSYIVSGRPFLTGSGGNFTGEKTVTFPYVTKRIVIENTRGGLGTPNKRLRVSLKSVSAGNVVSNFHYFDLANNVSEGKLSIDLNFKVKEIFLSAPGGSPTAFRLYAELTDIPSDRMFDLSGAGVDE